MQHPGVLFMRAIGPLPLAWIRALGALLGHVLYGLAASRRRVVLVNLALCFPHMPEPARRAMARQHFVYVAQAWLDRAWLWHGNEALLRRRLSLVGALHNFEGRQAAVMFAPHFVGLDAGGTALALMVPRLFASIYTPQSSAAADAWIRQGRMRFGQVRLCERADGVKPIVKALREGACLYLLPDMNFGPEESIFVPFYGVPAATVPSLPRFARLGRATVFPVTTRMTPTGYEVRVHPVWEGYPGDDVTADTALMNQRLEALIDEMPAQYYWVHKRFKTRPAGEPSVY